MGHWWDGTEDGSPETWRSPSRHWDRDRGSYPCEHTCILCAWANMQDHIPRDPTLHPRSDAQRVWVEVTRWAGPPAADDSRVRPGMGFTVIAVGSGPLQRPLVPQTVDGGQW